MIEHLFSWFRARPWVGAAELRVCALVGGGVYLAQAWGFAHSLESVLDEGAYLFKGLMFVRGQYVPFQDYGPLTNHMPLSFLTYGLVEQLFGEGIRTGRYFALALSALILLGLWLLTRRAAQSPPSSGEGWAALAVWALALNPAIIKMYSFATSQVLIFFWLVWALVLVTGKDRPLWQIVLGAAAAGVLMLTRINLAPAVALILGYVFWQHGRRAGLWASAAALGTIGGLHAIFWPGILRIWAYWLPDGLSPFLGPWRQPDEARFWDPSPAFASRVLSFFHGLRFHFVAVTGLLGLGVAWPRRRAWASDAQFRLGVLLASLFGTLALAHLAASLALSYCVFCFPIYLAFFSPLGLVGLAALAAALGQRIPAWRQAGVGTLVVGLSTGMGYGAFDEIGEALVRWRVPRLKTLFSGGGGSGLPLWDVLDGRFGIPFEVSKRLVPLVAGLLAGIVLVGLAIWLARRSAGRASFAAWALALTLGLGLALSPTPVLGGGFTTYDCAGDVLTGYESAGAHLAAAIPPGSQVYWKGGHSAVPLIYVPGIRIYPAQINGDYTIYNASDPDTLLKFGLWSDQLARNWLAEADFVLVEGRFYKGWMKDLIAASDLHPLEPTAPILTCRDDSQILIFSRQ